MWVLLDFISTPPTLLNSIIYTVERPLGTLQSKCIVSSSAMDSGLRQNGQFVLVGYSFNRHPHRQARYRYIPVMSIYSVVSANPSSSLFGDPTFFGRIFL
jgi:hypothetical protein